MVHRRPATVTSSSMSVPTGANGSYGLTTMLREHVSGRGDSISFDYPAKSGRQAMHAVVEPEVCEVVRQLRRRGGGGEHLLAYWQGRHWHDVHSDDLNQ